MTFKTLFIDDCFGRPESDPRRQKINILKDFDNITVAELEATRLFNFKHYHKNTTDILDLIFIDYKLSTDPNDIEGFSTGDQCESLVRGMCPDTPIYLLSMYVDKDKEFERPEGFERQVGENFLSDPDKVYKEIADHQCLRQAIESGNKDRLLSAFKCTDEFVKDDLLQAIPNSVRRCFKSKLANTQNSTPLVHGTKGPRVEFYRWFIDLFYRHTGFLVDNYATANLLGVKTDYFNDNISKQLDSALYNGVFSMSLPTRWWVGQLKEYFLDLDSNGILQQKTFAEGCALLLKVPDEAKARCVVCKELWPESLGYVQDDAQRDLHPVHISCSFFDPDADFGPYFNSPRLIIEDESTSD